MADKSVTAQESKKPAARPPVTAGVEQAVLPLPASVLLASRLVGWPDESTTTSLRQRTALQLQRQRGNRAAREGFPRLSAVHRSLVQRQPAGGGGVSDEAISKARAQQARAQKILLASYGNIRPIIAHPIVVLDDPAIKSQYDEMKVRKEHTNPRTGEAWERGDAARVFRTLDGFADRDQGTIYVFDDPSADAEARISLLAHEMLHMNAAGSFAGTVGPDIDEGTTELLTIKACKVANITPPPAYRTQVDLVGRLAEAVGEGTLQQAYFNGPSVLRSTFDAVRGEGSFQKLLDRLMKQGDMSGAMDLLRPPHTSTWVREKIMLIESHLNSWWVSDADMQQIIAICRSATRDELRVIREAIAPQVTKLSSHGQRARLRLALAG